MKSFPVTTNPGHVGGRDKQYPAISYPSNVSIESYIRYTIFLFEHNIFFIQKKSLDWVIPLHLCLCFVRFPIVPTCNIHKQQTITSKNQEEDNSVFKIITKEHTFFSFYFSFSAQYFQEIFIPSVALSYFIFRSFKFYVSGLFYATILGYSCSSFFQLLIQILPDFTFYLQI